MQAGAKLENNFNRLLQLVKTNQEVETWTKRMNEINKVRYAWDEMYFSSHFVQQLYVGYIKTHMQFSTIKKYVRHFEYERFQKIV